MGLSAARTLAAGGARVVVVERRRVGAEASGAAAGMIAPQAGEPHWHLLPLALKARDRHLQLAPELDEETGISVDLSRLGRLQLALDEAAEQALRALAEAHHAHGASAELLSGADVREAEPNVNPAVRSAAYFAGDRRLDNVRLTRGSRRQLDRRRVTRATGTRPCDPPHGRPRAGSVAWPGTAREYNDFFRS